MKNYRLLSRSSVHGKIMDHVQLKMEEEATKQNTATLPVHAGIVLGKPKLSWHLQW